MELNKFTAGGIIEIYCMGIATDEEKTLVEKLASESKEIRDEIAAVNEALKRFAIASAKTPSASLKNKIMDAIARSSNVEQMISFPPRLSQKSTVKEWLKYISDNSIAPPEGYDPFHWLDLPGDKTQATYMVWAKKGMTVEEEHQDEDEYLFMLHGRCSVTIDGKIGHYSKGDLVYIPKKSIHRAEALSDEPMLVVGQRIAA